MRYSLIFVFVSGFIMQSMFAHAQEKEHYWDSLERVSQRSPADTLSVLQLNELFTYYSSNGGKQAMPFAERALELADSLQFLPGQALSSLSLAIAHDRQGNFYQALQYYHKTLKLAKEHSYDDYRAKCLLSLGYFYGTQGNYSKAIEHTKEAALLHETLFGAAHAAYGWSNLGYYFLKEHQYDSALYYTYKSYEIFKAEQDSSGLGDVFFNLGSIAWEADSNAFKALNYCLKAQKMYRSGAFTEAEILIECKAQIGFLYTELKNFPKAAFYLNRALAEAKKNNLRYLIQVCYQHKAHMYAAAGDFNKAYQYHQLFYQLYDSLHSQQTYANIKQLQAEYELETKEAKIALLNKDQIIKQEELQRQLIIRNGFVGLVGLLLVLAAVLYRNNRHKRKSNDLLLEQKTEIEKKNKAIVRKNQMLQEQKRAMLFQSRHLHEANLQIGLQKKTIEQKNRDIISSLNYARNIQDAMLPQVEQLKHRLADFFLWLQPRDIVSGDFFWYHEQDGLLFLAAVDCTGHGVPGAFMSLIGDSYLNQIVKIEKEYEPDRILSRLSYHVNEVLKKEATDNQDGMEMSMCVIDLNKKELRFAGARNHLFYVQEKKLHKVRGNRSNIGGIKKGTTTVFSKHKISFQQPTCFYLFTDGIRDQFGGPQDKKYGEKQLKQLILDIHQLPMEKQKLLIKGGLEQWMEDAEQIDDILMVGWRLS